MTLPASKSKVGRDLLRVDPADWSTHRLHTAATLHRPIDVGFAPGDHALYIVDFGQFEMSDRGVRAIAGTGRLLRWDAWAVANSG